MDTWMISNQQPWPEALLRGLITCKTRSWGVHLPPPGAVVLLHASLKPWCGHGALPWVAELGVSVSRLDRGGIVGVAVVDAVGKTSDIMPESERCFFVVGGESCAGPQSIRFRGILRTPFIPCRGAQTPTRNVPALVIAELGAALRRVVGPTLHEQAQLVGAYETMDGWCRLSLGANKQ